MCFVHKFENNDSSPDWAGLNSSSVYLTQPMAPLLTFKRSPTIGSSNSPGGNAAGNCRCILVLGAQRGTEESGRKTGARGTPGNVVQALEAAIFFRRGVGQEASEDYKSQPPFRFVFVQKKKKKTHTPPPHSSLSHTRGHTHTHTYPRQTRTHPSVERKAASRHPGPPATSSLLGFPAARERGGRSRDL